MFAKIVAIPYKNFEQKIRITKKFGKMYHIEDFSMDSVVGILYMERKELNEQNRVSR